MLNICFKFFNQLTTYYEGWTTYAEPINSEIIFNNFLNKLFLNQNNEQNNYYYLIINDTEDRDSYLKFNIHIEKIEKKIKIL